nr:MAG: hypothetical protein [Leucocoprinus alphapartitivirus 1]
MSTQSNISSKSAKKPTGSKTQPAVGTSSTAPSPSKTSMTKALLPRLALASSKFTKDEVTCLIKTRYWPRPVSKEQAVICKIKESQLTENRKLKHIRSPPGSPKNVSVAHPMVQHAVDTTTTSSTKAKHAPTQSRVNKKKQLPKDKTLPNRDAILEHLHTPHSCTHGLLDECSWNTISNGTTLPRSVPTVNGLPKIDKKLFNVILSSTLATAKTCLRKHGLPHSRLPNQYVDFQIHRIQRSIQRHYAKPAKKTPTPASKASVPASPPAETSAKKQKKEKSFPSSSPAKERQVEFKPESFAAATAAAENSLSAEPAATTSDDTRLQKRDLILKIQFALRSLECAQNPLQAVRPLFSKQTSLQYCAELLDPSFDNRYFVLTYTPANEENKVLESLSLHGHQGLRNSHVSVKLIHAILTSYVARLRLETTFGYEESQRQEITLDKFIP